MAGFDRLLDDVRTARRIFRRGLRARRARNVAAVRFAEAARPAPFSVPIAVYFADGPVNLYQIRQWYAPLAELSRRHPVVIISRSPSAALVLADEAPVPVLHLRTIAEIEEFLGEQELRLVLYVNQNTKNFQMFRYGRMWHVFINHGESDKSYMTSNQYKAYDYAFVAGQAALDRLERKLWDYDVADRAIPIGRPQGDHVVGAPPFEPDGRTVVFYAPTWEGDRPTMAYGSIASHGLAIARAVLASPSHRLVYRPHPRSGVNDREYGAANQQIMAMIAAANARDPQAKHLADVGGELGWQIAMSDVQISDVSAMVYDRLATGKPLLVTRPVADTAVVEVTGYLGAAEWLDASEAPDVLAAIDRVLHDESSRANLAHWSQYHFGDTTPGSATARFHAAIERLLSTWEEHAAKHVGDPAGEGDPLDDPEDEDQE